MRVVLYARYSSEGQREASITDQFRNCDAYVARQPGWTITARYQDQALSGAVGAARRPGYQAVLAAAKTRQFDVLVVDDLSRLTRDEAELITLRKRLVFWGLRMVSASDGFDTAHKGHKIQASFHGIKNEQYLDDLAEKTHRGLAGQALQGLNTGGRCYGYRHVPIIDRTQTDEYGRPLIVGAKREIDDAQAEVVRQIFNWYANGQSPRWIAGELNRRGIPAPGAAYKRKKRTTLHGTWSPSVLHGDPKIGTGLLHNELYIGHLIWNRRDWVRDPDTTGKCLASARKPNGLKKTCRTCGSSTKRCGPASRRANQTRPLMRKATPPMNVKYLLSGLLKCGVCGSSFVMAGVHHYACAGYLNRRQCTNRIRVRRELVEAKCLDGLRRDLLTPERVELFVKEATRLWTERQQTHGSAKLAAEKRLAVVEQELAYLLTAIKAGLLTATTKAELMNARERNGARTSYKS